MVNSERVRRDCRKDREEDYVGILVECSDVEWGSGGGGGGGGGGEGGEGGGDGDWSDDVD